MSQTTEINERRLVNTAVYAGIFGGMAFAAGITALDPSPLNHAIAVCATLGGTASIAVSFGMAGAQMKRLLGVGRKPTAAQKPQVPAP